ncbi:hypothetical protein [Vreelandella sp. EE27]
MQVRIKKYRTVRAIGSVMEIWPIGNYSEHMPKGTPPQRMAQCWSNVGNQLQKAIKSYEQSATSHHLQ